MHLPRLQRLLHGYLTADLTYAIFTRRYPTPGETDAVRREQEGYLTGNYGVTWCAWMLASVLGIGLANFIPSAWGLGFAGVLCLIGILCSLANTPARLVAAVLACVAAVAAYSLPLKLNIVAAIAAAVFAGFWLEQRLPREWKTAA
jgi:predicted branched-subunit amino acid permease